MIVILGSINEVSELETKMLNNKPLSHRTVIISPLENPPDQVAINVWGFKADNLKFKIGECYLFSCKVSSKKGNFGWFTNITLLSQLPINSQLLNLTVNVSEEENLQVQNEPNWDDMADEYIAKGYKPMPSNNLVNMLREMGHNPKTDNPET